MTKILWPAGTLLAPVPPALISSGTTEKPNIMTAAWTGIVCTNPTLTYVSIRPERYTHQIISENKEFVINIPNLALADATDFCGVRSGRNIDKFKECHLTPTPCEYIAAPQIQEAPISLECKVLNVTPYGTHDMFLAEIKAVHIDDKYLDENGALHLEKAGLLAYAHGFYYTLGRQIGKFGHSVEKKKTMQKRIKRQKATAKKTSRNYKNHKL